MSKARERLTWMKGSVKIMDGFKLEAGDFLDAVANEIKIQARHADKKLRNVAKRGNRAAKQMERAFAKELKRSYKLAQKRLKESATRFGADASQLEMDLHSAEDDHAN